MKRERERERGAHERQTLYFHIRPPGNGERKKNPPFFFFFFFCYLVRVWVGVSLLCYLAWGLVQ
jgi:cell division septal protein FtsQ